MTLAIFLGVAGLSIGYLVGHGRGYTRGYDDARLIRPEWRR